MRLCCKFSLLFIVSQWTSFDEFCIIEFRHECQITTIIVVDWLSIDYERLVSWESLSFSVDCVVLFVESGSLNIHKFLVNAWVVETESESARVSLDWILLIIL